MEYEGCGRPVLSASSAHRRQESCLPCQASHASLQRRTVPLLPKASHGVRYTAQFPNDGARVKAERRGVLSLPQTYWRIVRAEMDHHRGHMMSTDRTQREREHLSPLLRIESGVPSASAVATCLSPAVVVEDCFKSLEYLYHPRKL